MGNQRESERKKFVLYSLKPDGPPFIFFFFFLLNNHHKKEREKEREKKNEEARDESDDFLYNPFFFGLRFSFCLF